MTHHSHYHMTRTQSLTNLHNDPDPCTLEDLTDQTVESEEENVFARLLGYEPEV